MKKVKFSELKNRLPFGFSYEGQIFRTYKLKPWRLKEEKVLAKLEDEDTGLGDHIGQIVSVLLESLDSLNFAELDETKKQLMLSQMYLADVFAMYVKARIENIGSSADIPIVCSCKNSFIFKADLNTLETLTFEDEDPKTYLFPFELKDGIQIEKKIYKKLKCRFVKFEVFKNMARGFDLNSATFRCAVFQSCIAEIEGYEIPHFVPTEVELETLRKIDFENLSEKLLLDSQAVDFYIDLKCPKCKRQILNYLTWSPDSFFVVHSGRFGQK